MRAHARALMCACVHACTHAYTHGHARHGKCCARSDIAAVVCAKLFSYPLHCSTSIHPSKLHCSTASPLHAPKFHHSMLHRPTIQRSMLHRSTPPSLHHPSIAPPLHHLSIPSSLHRSTLRPPPFSDDRYTRHRLHHRCCRHLRHELEIRVLVLT